MLKLGGRALGQAAVTAVRRQGEVVAWRKVWPTVEGAAREVAALRAASAVLGDSVPALVEHDGNVLVTAHVPGVDLDLVPPLHRDEAARQLGALLATLHAQRPGVDAVDVAEALERRARSWAKAAGAPPETLRRVLDLLDAAADSRRAPCHRDVRGPNVRWTGTRTVLIDWGQARDDVPDVDLVHLLDEPGTLTPTQITALWEGLGGAPDEARLAALRGLVALHGLATWGWGVRHGDPRTSARGYEVLARALVDRGAWRCGG